MNHKHFSPVYLLVLFVPETLLAHSFLEGMGDFYNGLLHPIFVPAHLLLLIAVGLFLGQQDKRTIQLALTTLPVTIIAGLGMAWFSPGIGLETFILTLSTTLGLLVAIKPRMSMYMTLAIVLAVGFFIGADSPQEELLGLDKLTPLLGSGVAIYFVTLYIMAMAYFFSKKEWQNIGIRVIGSWVAASSILVLTLSFSA